jgi:hypothetical protein
LKSLAVLLSTVAMLAAGCGGDGDGGESSTTPAPTVAAPSGTSAPRTTPSRTSPIPPVDQLDGDNQSGSGSNSKRGDTPRGEEPSKGGEPSRRARSTPESRRVERYLRDSFGGAGAEPKSDWYDHVVEVSVSGTTTTVRTDLPDSGSGKRQARQICQAVRGTVPGLTDEVRITGLKTGGMLASCVP